MTNFSIRKGQSSDWQQITFFQKQMALETEGKNLDQELVSQGVLSVFKKTKGFHKGFYLVAESESSLIGSLLVTREWSDWRNGWFWWKSIRRLWSKIFKHSRIFNLSEK